MNQLSKKAIASILSLVLVFVALGATTFAWFTLGTTATVGNFDLTARGSEGLEIQLLKDEEEEEYKGGQWYSTINSTVMSEFIDEILIQRTTDGKKRLDAVTTSDKETFETFGNVGEEGKVTFEKAVKNRDYVSFKLRFRTKQKDSTLILENLTFDTTQEKTWIPDVDYTNENGAEVGPSKETNEALKLNPQFAARVMFDVLSDDAADNIIYEDNATSQLETDLTMKNITGDNNNNQIGAHSYLSNKLGLTVKGPDQNNVRNLSEDKTFEGAQDADKELIDFSTTLEKYYYVAEIGIVVWLEGWDANTYDAIFDGSLSIGFEFKLNNPTPNNPTP